MSTHQQNTSISQEMATAIEKWTARVQPLEAQINILRSQYTSALDWYDRLHKIEWDTFFGHRPFGKTSENEIVEPTEDMKDYERIADELFAKIQRLEEELKELRNNHPAVKEYRERMRQKDIKDLESEILSLRASKKEKYDEYQRLYYEEVGKKPFGPTDTNERVEPTEQMLSIKREIEEIRNKYQIAFNKLNNLDLTHSWVLLCKM